MGRIDKNDERYYMLARMPRNQNGRVVFRKKRTHACSYTLCVLEIEEKIIKVLYKLNPKSVDEMGNPCAMLSFDECALLDGVF
jgi:hypothetical protein